jgi:hypothetical protein
LGPVLIQFVGKMPVLRYYLIRPIVYGVGIAYLLVDALVLSFIRPLGRRLMQLAIFQHLQRWIDGLNRYAALALFLIPLALLEPVKPVSVYMIAHKKHLLGLIILVGGELLKVTLLERIFSMTKPQLMTFKWFAWCYGRWTVFVARLKLSTACVAVKRQSQDAQKWIRGRWRALGDYQRH